MLDGWKDLKPFKAWCVQVLPTIFDESMSYYECLCKMVKLLNDTMNNVDLLNEAYENFTESTNTDIQEFKNSINNTVQQLQNFVNNYFDNLDVQEEINNKLDGMIESGELSTIISPLVLQASVPIFVDSISKMTNQGKIYVLTTNSHLYYYENGWKDSGMSYGVTGTDNWLQYRGNFQNLGYTQITQCQLNGFYRIPGSYLANITDLPDDYTGGGGIVLCYSIAPPNTSCFYTLQNSTSQWLRFSNQVWYNVKDFTYQGDIKAGNLSEKTKSGWYTFRAADIGNITDLPIDWGNDGGIYIVFSYPPSKFQFLTGVNKKLYTRYTTSGSTGTWFDTQGFNYGGEITTGSLLSIKKDGWYNFIGASVQNITDLPNDWGTGGGMVINYGYSPSRIQFLVGINKPLYYRYSTSGSQGIWYKFFNITEIYKGLYGGRLTALGYTAISKAKDNKFYNFTTSDRNSITDLPDDFPSIGGMVVNFHLTNPIGYYQLLISNLPYIYIRYVNNNGDPYQWNRIPQWEEKKGLILGDSICAGTYSINSVNTVTTPNYSFIRRAFLRRHITPDNRSAKGMGFVRQGTEQQTIRNILPTLQMENYDFAFVMLGSNDWNYNLPLGSLSDSAETESIYGGIKYTLNQLLQKPLIKIIMATPFNRATRGNFESMWAYNSLNEANTPYSLKDVCDAIKEVCAQYGVEVLDLTNSCIINSYNINDILLDKTHPSLDGMNSLIPEIAARLNYNISAY